MKTLFANIPIALYLGAVLLFAVFAAENADIISEARANDIALFLLGGGTVGAGAEVVAKRASSEDSS